ncbi:hypothetical protein V5G99_10350 [Bibersteinia trehalosi]|uniref:Uncharacterized protein n=1 Tax=Bibersteinia trehalosi TaxID=47735 RepID=A0A426FF81_BIBTR|nr:hypothetical protein [Bibersteinia trehalosi]RRN01040.1 hypothetical protein EIM44_10325 [Bibersteinia trehalosi]TCT18393.1 hypothetical protein EDC51_101105 [Bibersteinia trehalosi]
MPETIYIDSMPQIRLVILDVILNKGKIFDEINKKLEEKGFSFKEEKNDDVWHFFRFTKKQEFHFNQLDNAEKIIESDIGKCLDCNVRVKLSEV